MHFTVKQLLLWTGLIAVVVGAYVRGVELFGFMAGILYVALSALFILVLRPFFLTQHSQTWECRTLGVIFGAALFGILMFPYAFDNGPFPGLSWLREQRTTQVQINEVISRHPRFSNLEIKCNYIGYLTLTVHGSLKNEIDMMILRENIIRYCPLVDLKMVKWKIILEESGFTLDNWDDEIYGSNSKFPIFECLRTQTDASWELEH